MSHVVPPPLTKGTVKHNARSELAADRGWRQRTALACQDLVEAFKLYRLVWALAFSDIKLRYRGSAIGPFWLTISTGVQIGAMAFVYADLFHTDIHTYLPYLCTSIVIWSYLSSMVSNGCTSFVGSDGLIKGSKMPLTVHAIRSVLRDTITFGHNLVVIIVVFVVMDVHISLAALWAIPGLLLWLIDGLALALALGAICARFRDIPQIANAFMQIAFFVTPVMWSADSLKGHKLAQMVIGLNPFYYLLEIVRSPLLGDKLTLSDVVWALAISAVIVVGSLVVFARTRGRIAFWV